MYAAVEDPYCYPGTAVLINKLGIRDAHRLEVFEEEATRERASLAMPAGRLGIRHFQAIHHHLFQDVYGWAGRFRTVRIARQGSVFCYPENIPGELRRLFAWLKAESFLRNIAPDGFTAKAAHALADLNAIHAFRDGNGRTQLAFLGLLADRAGQPLNFARLRPDQVSSGRPLPSLGLTSSPLWRCTPPGPTRRIPLHPILPRATVPPMDRLIPIRALAAPRYWRRRFKPAA